MSQTPSRNPPAPEALIAMRARAQALSEEGAPLPQVLSLLASAAEAVAPVPAHASILLIDGRGLLRNAASPNLPSDYLDAIDRLRPDPAVGTCAAAAATGEVVVTRSFTSDHAWAELRHLPLAIGYRSAWSMPIKGEDGAVLGTFGTYFMCERAPSEAEVEVVRALAIDAASAVRRARARVPSAEL